MSNSDRNYTEFLMKFIIQSQEEYIKVDKNDIVKNKFSNLIMILKNEIKENELKGNESPKSKIATENSFGLLATNNYVSGSRSGSGNENKNENAIANGKSNASKFLVPKHKIVPIVIKLPYNPFERPIIIRGKEFGMYRDELFDYYGRKICSDGYFYLLDDNNNPTLVKNKDGSPKKYQLVAPGYNVTRAYVHNATAKLAKHNLVKCKADLIGDFDDVINHDEIKDLSFLVFKYVDSGITTYTVPTYRSNSRSFYMSCEKANYKDDNPKVPKYAYHGYIISDDNRLIPFINKFNGKWQRNLWGIDEDINNLAEDYQSDESDESDESYKSYENEGNDGNDEKEQNKLSLPIF